MPLFARTIELKSITHDEDDSSPEFLSTISRLPNWTITPSSLSTFLGINFESRVEMRPLPFNSAETASSVPGINMSCTVDTLFINLTYKSVAHNFIPRVFEEIFETVNITTLKEELRRLAGNKVFWDAVLLSSRGKDFIFEFKKSEDIILVVQKEESQEDNRQFQGFEEFEEFELENDIERREIKSLSDALKGTFETGVRKVSTVSGVWGSD
jgi:hypothetical protein